MEEILETIPETGETLEQTLDEAWEKETAPDAVWDEEEADPGGVPEDEAEPGDGQAPEEAAADQPGAFTLKHLDETRTVDRDEVIRLAQQGMDYGRVRAERDQLRAYRDEAGPALELVKSYAEANGMPVEAYLEQCRGEGPALPLLTEGAREAARRGEARRAEMARFVRDFPAVQPEEIPREVWAGVARGEGLTSAYALHRSRSLEADLAAERQNRQNEQRTTGSLSDSGEAARPSELDRWWDEYE